ncbi:hypothetical protein [Gemmatimonas sp.]|uniref:hypothetical protein n=1 Tax=Gemmatimonas sp. TaxID=1962908 RepID=UPI003DA230F6
MEELDVNSTARLELASLLTSAHRAADLTKQILVFSRRQVVMPTDSDGNATLRAIQRVLARLLGEHIALRRMGASCSHVSMHGRRHRRTPAFWASRSPETACCESSGKCSTRPSRNGPRA